MPDRVLSEKTKPYAIRPGRISGSGGVAEKDRETQDRKRLPVYQAAGRRRYGCVGKPDQAIGGVDEKKAPHLRNLIQ